MTLAAQRVGAVAALLALATTACSSQERTADPLGAVPTGTVSVSAAPGVPAHYRAAVVAAGQICTGKVDQDLVAAIIDVETGRNANYVGTVTGSLGPGNLHPDVVARFQRAGERATDPAAGTMMVGRYLCDLAAQVDEKTSRGDRPAAYATAYLTDARFAAGIAEGTAPLRGDTQEAIASQRLAREAADYTGALSETSLAPAPPSRRPHAETNTQGKEPNPHD